MTAQTAAPSVPSQRQNGPGGAADGSPTWLDRSVSPGAGDVLRAGESRVPRLPGGYVPRRRLWARLDQLCDRPLTLLVGPAGAGKTLGVAGWVRERALDRAEPLMVNQWALWVQADRSWSTAKLLDLLDLAAAGPRVAADGVTDPESRRPAPTVHGRSPAPRSAVGPDGRPQLIVLDDAHLLPPSALAAVDRRLSEAPDSMRLLLLSRWDLPFTRLTPQLLGDFNVVHGDILRLDDAESAALVETHAGTAAPDVAAAIAARAQGWCAAVVLMARAVGSSSDPLAASRRYSLTDTSFGIEVATEVFSALTPRERHVLLCVAVDDEFSVDAATHLSHEPRAVEFLAGLEKSGILLNRVDGRRVVGTDLDATVQQTEGGQMYRLHPLIADALRQRLLGGGVEVARARATVVRAVALDVSRGEISRAFDRLTALDAANEAATLLATHGVDMIMRGGGAPVASFVLHHADAVNAMPATSFPIALQRWTAGDTDNAVYWLDGVLRARRPDVEIACARLMRSRLGLESIEDAVEFGQRQVLAARRPHMAEPVEVNANPLLASILLTELGATQNWLGDLLAAEVNLTAAMGLARNRAPGLAAEATSHLAMTEYMRGREHASVELATETLAILNEALPWRPRFTATRATLAMLLAGLVDVPWPAQPIEPLPWLASAVHPADLVARFWMRIRDVHLPVIGGSAMDGEAMLTAPLGLPVTTALPPHLQVVVSVARALLASLAVNQHALRDIESELRTLGMSSEASLVAGLRADLAGDRRHAIGLFSAAAQTPSYPQPASRGLALVCEAQLLDAVGDELAGQDKLRQAAIEMEIRRNASPFLGWTRHGTPIRNVLARLADDATPWIEEVVAAAQNRPDVVVEYAVRTATPQERATVPSVVVRPLLSAREREVLTELARGSTYADISANLFVSENTVKTHVSNLYGKLGASRRSEALAAARSQNLI
jgi:LuxR family transcriptional regulator, maltose regulon positive regulatory protein